MLTAQKHNSHKVSPWKGAASILGRPPDWLANGSYRMPGGSSRPSLTVPGNAGFERHAVGG